MNTGFEHNLNTRAFFMDLLDTLSLETLNNVPTGFSNNIIWNITHVMVTQQGLTYGLAGLPKNVNDDLVQAYKNGTKPVAFVNAVVVKQLKEQLTGLIKQTALDYENGLFKDFKSYTTSTGYKMDSIDDAIHMNNIHEGIHLGYVMALRKAMNS